MSQRKRNESQLPQKSDVRLTELSICIRMALIEMQQKVLAEARLKEMGYDSIK